MICCTTEGRELHVSLDEHSFLEWLKRNIRPQHERDIEAYIVDYYNEVV